MSADRQEGLGAWALRVVRREDADILRQAILASGLSASAFARDVLVRNPRTVRRWLAGHSPIPKAVLDLLTRQWAVVAK